MLEGWSVSEDQGRHAAEAADAGPSDGLSARPYAGPDDDAAFRRPPGLREPFEPRPEPPVYTPAPPTVSPADSAEYGRPAGAGPYAAPPGDRIVSRPNPPPAVPWVMTSAFGAPGPRRGRVRARARHADRPTTGEPESPWWKRDAVRDPWRDPAAPFWLGRGAVFSAGQPAQLDPTQDVEHEDDGPAADEDEDKVVPLATGRRRLGISAILLGVLIAVLAGAVGGFGGYFLGGRTSDALHRTDVSLPQGGQPANRPPNSVAGIAARIGPAVVSLQVTSSDKSRSGVGSGVVIDKNGYVITNNHVAAVAKDGGTIIATFSNEATARARSSGSTRSATSRCSRSPTTS